MCSEQEAHVHGIKFRVCNLGSKQPHLYSAYVVSIASQLHTTICYEKSSVNLPKIFLPEIIIIRNWKISKPLSEEFLGWDLADPTVDTLVH